MRRALLALCLVGCARTAPPRKPVAVAPPLEITPIDVDAGAPPVSVCKLTDDATIDDGNGKFTAEGGEDLGSVRILGDDASTVVTWTRTSHYRTGDTWRTPELARRAGAGKFEQVTMPVMSTACATYGSVSPNTIALPFTVWGAMSTNAFEQFAALPAVAKDPFMNPAPYTRPQRFVSTPKQDVDDFVASHDVALARLTEMSCDVGCECFESWKNALWLRSLDPKKPFAVRVVAGKTDAEAFVLGEAAGVAAWRVKNELFYLRVDANGKPVGAPTSFATGDVGAPAVAMTGSDPILVWATRDDEDAPYQLQWMKVGDAPRRITTRGSAFAPAIIADEKRLVLAWMEGDGGKAGEIHVVRTMFDHPAFEGAVISGSETNARDPELSGSVARPAIVWQSFTKEKAAGILRVGRLACGP